MRIVPLTEESKKNILEDLLPNNRRARRKSLLI